MEAAEDKHDTYIIRGSRAFWNVMGGGGADIAHQAKHTPLLKFLKMSFA